jgi:hypothetical protein
MRERCVICFETVEGHRRQYSTCGCHTMIHPYCLAQWDKSQERSNTCPLCRRVSSTAAKEVSDTPVIVTKTQPPQKPKQKSPSQPLPQPSAPPVTYRESNPVDYADAYQSVVYIPIPVYMEAPPCNQHTISLPSVRCPTIQPCTGEVKKNRCAIFGIGVLLMLIIIYIVVIAG